MLTEQGYKAQRRAREKSCEVLASTSEKSCCLLPQGSDNDIFIVLKRPHVVSLIKLEISIAPYATNLPSTLNNKLWESSTAGLSSRRVTISYKAKSMLMVRVLTASSTPLRGRCWIYVRPLKISCPTYGLAHLPSPRGVEVFSEPQQPSLRGHKGGSLPPTWSSRWVPCSGLSLPTKSSGRYPMQP